MLLYLWVFRPADLLSIRENLVLPDFQKTSSEMFYKKRLFLNNSQYSQESICVRVSLFPSTLLKSDSNTCAFLWILQIFKAIYFEEHLRTAASFSWRLSNMISLRWTKISCNDIGPTILRSVPSRICRTQS